MAHRTPSVTQQETQQAAISGLRTIIAALNQSARAIEARTGITNAQIFLLQQLQATDALSINELAARARIGQSAVSIVVERLVRDGLVHRQRSAIDGRRATVSLTHRGRALVRRAPEAPTTRLLAAVSALKNTDLQALARGVQALMQAMDISDAIPAMLFEHGASAQPKLRTPRANKLNAVSSRRHPTN